MAAEGVSDRFWSARGLADAAEGVWRHLADDGGAAFRGVAIDSREVKPGDLFVALRGERFDGHDFVREALAKGALGAMVEREASSEAPHCATPLLEVEDTLAALHRLAHRWRDVLGERGCRVIAVGGSNGKTTTRHLIHNLLREARVHGCRDDRPADVKLSTHKVLRGTQSPRSFNNHIGVPLTLLGAAAEDDFVVAEVGTSRPGEIAQLGALLRPDIAVIVSIGREHLEALGTLEGVAAEELSLLRFVASGGMGLIPADPWLEAHVPTLPPGVALERIEGESLVREALPWPGEHAAHNGAAAARVARWMGVGDDHIGAALRCVEPVPGRFVVREVGGGGGGSTVGEAGEAGGITLIDDTYNANPDSVRVAVQTVCSQWSEARRRVFVFGDMLELGEASVASHGEIGRLIGRSAPSFAVLVAVGSMAMFTAAQMRRLRPEAEVYGYPQWDDDLPQRVAELLLPGDVVLLKGSRSMGLERIIPALERRAGEFSRPPDQLNSASKPRAKC